MLTKGRLLFPFRYFHDELRFLTYKRNVAEYVASICEDGSSVLDVGCDDGTVSKMILDFKPALRIVGVDVQANSPSKIEKKVYNGKNLPFPAGSFDTVMALDVLHHIPDIPAMLEEMKKVSRKHIIIKDHLVCGPLSRLIVGVADYISNVGYGIKCAFNYLSLKEFEALFRMHNLEVVEVNRNLNLGFGQFKRYHVIFKLRKVT